MPKSRRFPMQKYVICSNRGSAPGSSMPIFPFRPWSMSGFERRPDAATLEQLQAQLRPIAPDTRLDSHSSWMAPFFDLMSALVWLAAAVLFAAAGGHFGRCGACGAQHAQHASRNDRDHAHDGRHRPAGRTVFQRRVALDALLGGVVGFGAAAAVILTAGRAVCGGRARIARWRLLPVVWLGGARAHSACGDGPGYAYGPLDSDFGAQEDVMIRRLISFALLVWALGFAWFALVVAATRRDSQNRCSRCADRRRAPD